MILHLVDFRKRMRDRVRRALMKAVLNTLQQEPDIAGFALVAWDDRGCSVISYEADHGVVTTRLIPEHVKTALQGQLTAGDVAWRYRLDEQER